MLQRCEGIMGQMNKSYVIFIINNCSFLFWSSSSHDTSVQNTFTQLLIFLKNVKFCKNQNLF